MELFAYIETLQNEFEHSDWSIDGAPLRSKHRWRETYYFPAGMIRYAYFCRLLYGFYCFNSHLDGVMGWTLYRVRSDDPFRDGGPPCATLAYPGKRMLYGTYSLEAIREGLDDLRYTQQAYRSIAALLSSQNADRQTLGRQLQRRFLDTLKPYRTLVANDRRIDLMHDEADLQRTREAMAAIIIEAMNP